MSETQQAPAQEAPVKEPITYVIKRGQPIDKFVGYKKERSYSADENLGICDCIGFNNHTHCKHLNFKQLLDDPNFKCDEMIFFGENIGDCRPKTEAQMEKILLALIEPLDKHFGIVDIDCKPFIKHPAYPNLFSSIQFTGKRKKQTLIVGWASGILFWLRPEPLTS